MLVSTSIILFALAAFGAAQDVDDNDVPQQCRDVCAAVVTLSRNCDAQFDDNDSGYLNCVCSAQGASSQVPFCDACISASGDHDNDVDDLVHSCSFSSTTYTSGATAATSISNLATITSAPTSDGSTSTTIYTTTVPDDDDDDNDLDTSTITSRTVVGGAAATSGQSSGATTTSGSNTGGGGTGSSAVSSASSVFSTATGAAASSLSSVVSSATGVANSAASSVSSAAGAAATGIPMLGAAGAAMIALRML